MKLTVYIFYSRYLLTTFPLYTIPSQHYKFLHSYLPALLYSREYVPRTIEACPERMITFSISHELIILYICKFSLCQIKHILIKYTIRGAADYNILLILSKHSKRTFSIVFIEI